MKKFQVIVGVDYGFLSSLRLSVIVIYVGIKMAKEDLLRAMMSTILLT